jgi:hypothetical protein
MAGWRGRGEEERCCQDDTLDSIVSGQTDDWQVKEHCMLFRPSLLRTTLGNLCQQVCERTKLKLFNCNVTALKTFGQHVASYLKYVSLVYQYTNN